MMPIHIEHISEILSTNQDAAWLPWAVQYFFYISLAYGASVLFCLAVWHPKRFSRRLGFSSAVVMVSCAIVAALALSADLHQPGRAWHFYAYLTPWSWMSRGALLLPAFVGLVIITVGLWCRHMLMAGGADNQFKGLKGVVYRLICCGKWTVSYRLIKIMAFITLMSGMSIAFYTGAEIYAVKSRELWHSLWYPSVLFISGLTGALGAVIMVYGLLTSFKSLATSEKYILNKLLLGITAGSILSIIFVFFWIMDSSQADILTHTPWVNQLIAVVILLLLPCVAAPLAIIGHGRVVCMVAAVLSLAANVGIRWFSMMELQLLPKYDAGLFSYALPWGSNGIGGIFGMFGLVLAIVLILSEWGMSEERFGLMPSVREHCRG